ncbi:Non-heme chloroperoxidase [Cyphellophora attinorum]|uniref:Non-heme chloroperoxidase n=1 Tax=Cyphellophora attinorum TaxID=1664694 RepID=A0A0N0NJR2_9EURO|nr:Non-heme chloroperoxidase [Phialophora attinorum]KPI37188.1 Non-heme chloroperoxidase [Phialophora attinorum]
MPFFSARDGTSLFYRDWGNRNGTPIVFSHGWPLNGDNWEKQLVFFANNGYRAIAHDRRGHGRSDQPWEGNNVDTWADDLRQLIEHLNLKDVLIAAFISSCYPYMEAKHFTANGQDGKGVPSEVFDHFRDTMLQVRADFFIEVPSAPFFGFNRPHVTKNQGLIDNWFQAGMLASLKAVHDTTYSWQLDYTKDVSELDIPTLVFHGTDDQVVPIDTGYAAAKLLKNCTAVFLDGAPHATPDLRADELNAELLKFLEK